MHNIELMHIMHFLMVLAGRLLSGKIGIHTLSMFNKKTVVSSRQRTHPFSVGDSVIRPLVHQNSISV